MFDLILAIAMHQLDRADPAADLGPLLKPRHVAARGDLGAERGGFAPGAQTEHPHHLAGGPVDLRLGHKLLINRTHMYAALQANATAAMDPITSAVQPQGLKN